MISGEPLVAGPARGQVLVLEAPLSLWGGLDPRTGLITDIRHPQHGVRLTGRVLVLQTGRGSSSSSTILAEATRRGTGPAAIVLAEADPVLVVGAIVADRLYGRTVPILRTPTLDGLATGQRVRISRDGRIEFEGP